MFGNLKEFPKPLGNYVVGITQLDFLDEHRKGLFAFAKDEPRKIPARIYYPADDHEGKASERYLFEEEARTVRKFSLGLIPLKSLNIGTHCYPDLKVSDRMDRYPVLFYNHGYFAYSSQGTVLCSDLASRGYIVISLGHPYESGAVKYTDGQAVEYSKELRGSFKKLMSKENVKKFKAFTRLEYKDDEVAAAAEEFYGIFQGKPVWDNVKIWADDTRFVADQLHKLQDGSIPSIFKGHLNLELGFGITGHSYGGCTAAQVIFDDPRFKCGVNLDAPTYGDYWDQDLRKPFMILGSPIVKNAARTLFLRNSEDSYLILIDRTEHMDFSDYPFFANQTRILKMIGKNDRHLVRTIVSTYHLDFFDKYLLGEDRVDLRKPRFAAVTSRFK